MNSAPCSSQPCASPNRAEPIRLAEAGFTLVELLIAITLLGLVAFMAVGSLRFGARVWDRTTENSEADGRVRAVQSLIREQLGRSVVVRKTFGVNLASTSAIRGAPQAIEYFAPLPASDNSGRIVRQRLALGEAGFGLTWTEIDDDLETTGSGQTTLLLPGVTRLRYAYLAPGRGGDEPAWTERWEKTALPLLVRLSIEFEESSPYQWPELVVAPRPIIP